MYLARVESPSDSQEHAGEDMVYLVTLCNYKHASLFQTSLQLDTLFHHCLIYSVNDYEN